MAKQFRLQGYDYGSEGYYFITICTIKMKKYFGSLNRTPTAKFESSVLAHDNASEEKATIPTTPTCYHTSVQLSLIGLIAREYWLEIPKHFRFVKLDSFIIMPNHLHAILYFDKPKELEWIPNEFKARPNTLGSIIRNYKSSVKRYANQNKIEFDWMPRYHDSIIRSNKDLINIRHYIESNPERSFG